MPSLPKAFLCFLSTVPASFCAIAQESPFAQPGRPPPPSKFPPKQLPSPKISAPVVQKPSPYELRGYYHFEGKWHFALYHLNDKQSAWLTWEHNSTSVEYEGQTFVFDPENQEVSHEGFKSVQLADETKPQGKPFVPTSAKPNAPAKKPSTGTKPVLPPRPGAPRPGAPIPKPGAQFSKPRR